VSESADSSLLRAQGIEKSFAGVRALGGVGLHVEAGEVLAVIGENGAGKSTLMKILAGVEQQDAGELSLDASRIRFRTALDALHAGIALIHQELNLAGNLDVGANIWLGHEPRRWSMIDHGQIRRRSIELLERVGLDVDPGVLVDELTVGRRQLVEIAKALSHSARVLIMDEPTSSLTVQEARRLFEVIRSLKAKGVAIIYISHRLAEVDEIADRVLVLRDGLVAGHLDRTEISHDAMVRLMIGRDLSRFYARQATAPGEPVLELRGVRTPAFPAAHNDVCVRAGEIVGLAGLVGAGRTELLEAVFGLTQMLAGEVRIRGRAVDMRSVRDAVDAGLALVPEDRQAHGLLLEDPIGDNLSLTDLARVNRCGLRHPKREHAVARNAIKELDIRTSSERQPVQTLSGGNQQKVVLGKWLGVEPRVLLLDEPTRGVDVGAKAEIYRIMERLAADGLGILFASSDLEEILGMADRVLVMKDGAITGELSRDEMSEEAIMRLATRKEAAA
jgi:ribose transport system ATP-binding protein